MPRITILTQVYPPEIHPTAVMVEELAETLVEQEWDVQIIAGFPHHGQRRLYDGYKKSIWKKESCGAIDVLRTWHVISSSKSILARSVVFGTQTLSSTIGSLFVEKSDVVLVFGPPLFGPVLASLVAKKHRAKLVNVIHDIHPDIAIEEGKVKNRVVIGAARKFEQIQYSASDLTVILSEGFRQTLLDRGVSDDRMTILPVWLDGEEIVPADRNNRWRREQNIPLEKTVVLYAGTIGWVSGATVAVEAAEKMQDREDVLFLFVGDGAMEDAVQQLAAENDLKNIRFLPFQPRERLSEVQATADISLVTMFPGRGRTSVPSKVVGYMAAGRPVLAAVDADSDTGREIAKQEVGVVVPAGDADGLAGAVRDLAGSPEKRRRLGENGRRWFETHHEKHVVLENFSRELKKLVSG